MGINVSKNNVIVNEEHQISGMEYHHHNHSHGGSRIKRLLRKRSRHTRRNNNTTLNNETVDNSNTNGDGADIAQDKLIEIGNLKKLELSLFKDYNIIDSLDFKRKKNNNNEEEQTMDLDIIASLPKEIQIHILSYTSHNDIISLQSVCKTWHSIGRDPNIWKQLILRDCKTWTNNQYVEAIVRLHGKDINISWKRVYGDLWRWRLCKCCSKLYRQCHNHKMVCKVHSGIRDIIETRSSLPSGVYWACCLAKPKDAKGCKATSHEDTVSDNNYYPLLLQN